MSIQWWLAMTHWIETWLIIRSFLLGFWFGMIFTWIVCFFPKEKPVAVRPAYDIKKEYATVKVTTNLCDVKPLKLESGEWWERNAHEATAYLGPLDWHDRKIPKRLSMIFVGLPEGWGVQVDSQTPETDWPASHVYMNNKPTPEFLLELDNPDVAYMWRVVFYPKLKDADPNVHWNDVKVDFAWKVNRVR